MAHDRKDCSPGHTSKLPLADRGNSAKVRSINGKRIGFRFRDLGLDLDPDQSGRDLDRPFGNDEPGMAVAGPVGRLEATERPTNIRSRKDRHENDIKTLSSLLDRLDDSGGLRLHP